MSTKCAEGRITGSNIPCVINGNKRSRSSQDNGAGGVLVSQEREKFLESGPFSVRKFVRKTNKKNKHNSIGTASMTSTQKTLNPSGEYSESIMPVKRAEANEDLRDAVRNRKGILSPASEVGKNKAVSM